MKGLEHQCFQIISAVGSARSLFIEAVNEAKRGDFPKAQALIKEGEAMFNQGHLAHATLIQQEAGGHAVPCSLLLIHAEDQLMSAEEFKIIANELIASYRRIIALETKQGMVS